MNWQYPTADFPKCERPDPLQKGHAIGNRFEICLACEGIEKISAHHLTPVQISGKKTKKIGLCIPCHKIVHRLTNSTIASMNQEQQILFIRSSISLDKSQQT